MVAFLSLLICCSVAAPKTKVVKQQPQQQLMPKYTERKGFTPIREQPPLPNQQDDRDEKIETKIRASYKNLINKTLKPVYAKYADDTNFKMGKKWHGYQDMLEKEKTLIDNMFQGKVPIFTSIEDFKMQFPKEIQGKKNEEIIDAAEQVFARSVSSGTLPKFYLHTTAFGSESEFSKMISNFRNVNLGE